MKVVIVGGVAGGASCAARLRRLDEKAEILMVERGPYVSYANCGLPYHVSGVIAKESSLLVANEQVFRVMHNIDVRTNCEAIAIVAEGQDRGPAQRRHRRGDDRVLRQARAVARGAVGAAAAAGHRPARDLPGADRARRADDPRVDREGHRVPGRDVQLLGHPVREADAAGGGDRRRVHRARDGGEPRPCRVRRDPGRDARPGAGAARSRIRPTGRGPRQAAWRAPGDGRRRGRLHATRGRCDRGQDEVGQGVPGRHRHPGARRAARHDAGQGRPASRSASAAASAWTTRCARATRTSSPSATPSRSRTSSRASGAWWRWPGRPTGRAASPPT